MATEQSSQQAASAANQQLQAGVPTTPGSIQGAIQSDSLACQWAGCGDRATTPEQLYEHLCERHIGRKSTNNLNLTCQWGNCRTTTVKRDHITSHVRVHVPLKPHKCEFCGKSFKRPQDLKKHVKTHADESVLMRSPEPSSSTRNQPNVGYPPMGSQPRPGNGYYSNPQSQPTMPMNYNNPYQGHNGNVAGNTAPGFVYGPTHPTTNQGYGVSYYQLGNGSGVATSSMNPHSQVAIDHWFRSLKTQQINPSNYEDIHQSLAPLRNVPLPFSNTGGGLAAYSGGQMTMDHQSATGHYVPTAPTSYPLDISGLQSKEDYLDVATRLETMNRTAYEYQPASATGVSQPPTHQVATGTATRLSNSPPRNQFPPSHLIRANSSSTNGGTPEMTSGSSVYSNGHSPPSMGFNDSMSPTQQNPTTGVMYPSLPTHGPINGNTTTPTLGNQYERSRRYSGGRLQRAAPGTSSRRADDMDIDSETPHATKAVFSKMIDPALSGDTKMIDPALSGEARSRSGSLTPSPNAVAEEEVDNVWVNNMRILEGLKEFVAFRLKQFDTDGGEAAEEQGKTFMYPELKV
ncbi:hypothetical protein MMC11_004376 [Xylographa trunciseda]|nr:hypothetical protein [Xylographa trunciseda]